MGKRLLFTRSNGSRETTKNKSFDSKTVPAKISKLGKEIIAVKKGRYPIIPRATHLATERNRFQFVLMTGSNRSGNNGKKYYPVPKGTKSVSFKITANGKRGGRKIKKPVYSKKT
ncbi:MAG: hypothetical protein A3H02_02490 [Candidatus Niyogibacteria bacterium RIFCSPLOWO2_12_FULL_41_13]|uniref:Uncharacterized protein n=1 Tax=Candidatus Niyogibacteria bacterium RIFCSPLOWO2_12_FULL_41_13 TaxID=1801726 RepID=A0A1G2F1A8_9BACT|nr:MAG: hypothetical protein A3H02_02490 [Candidatus Niyogibacteria bacterium RIFCSPLOWO2_12_FULL_41_13]